MRHPRLGSILTALVGGMFLCGPSRASTASEASGLGIASALGAGATARVDPAAALFENPGRLARLSGSEAWSSVAAATGRGVLRVAVNTPLLAGPVLGLGVSSLDGPLRRDNVHLGAAQGLPHGVAAGAVVTLVAQSEAEAVHTSFGLDLGLHWRPTSRVELGLALANAVQPQLGTDTGADPRELRAALAWMQPLRGDWSAGTSIGWRAPDDDRGQAAATALLRRGNAEVAAGVHDGGFRCGGALALGVLRVAYAYGADAGTHDIALQWRFGASRDARQLQCERRTEMEIAARARALAALAEHDQALTWNSAADSALAHGSFDAAVDLYAAAVALQPANARAREGLRRARHGKWVQMADSLLGRQETAGAAVALELALRCLPEDSLSAHRLQELRAVATSASRMQDLVTQRFAEGMQAFAQQRYLDAVHAFEDVLRLDPEHTGASMSLQQAQSAHALWRTSTLRSARQRYDAGDDTEAAAYVRRLLDVEPRHAEAQKLLARIEHRSRRERSEPQSPAAPVVRGEDAAPVSAAVAARYQEGMQLYRSGDLIGAMHAWEEVSRLAPHYEEVDRNLLRVYRVTGLESYTEGRLREAVEIWEKALRLEPGNEQLRRYVNQAQAKLARTPAADPAGR